MSQPHYNAVVVGGGCAGTYAAWQMQTAQVSSGSPLPQDPSQRSIALFEMSNRIGGRLESIVPPGMSSTYAEFGGFGFTSKDTTLNAVVKTLQLNVSPFKGSTGANLFYLRGQRFTVAQANTKTFQPPYVIDQDQLGVDPRSFVPTVIANAFPGSGNWDEAQWQQATSGNYNGRPYSDTGFWNFLLENMTNEQLSYARDATGHFFEVANWNCAQALPWYALDGNASYSTLTDGYDILPKTMAADFAKAGGNMFMNTGVLSVEKRIIGPQGQSTIEVVLSDGQTCSADVVVFALPKRSLEMVSSEILTEAAELIGSVTGQPVLKVWCCYDKPWWNNLGITQGSSATDLPLGQCWYFGPDPENGAGLLLAAYDDTLGPTFWEGLEIGQSFPSGNNPDPNWAAQAVSADIIGTLQIQLAELHDIDPKVLPEPYAAAWMDWSEDPYGGAFNTWNVGVDAVSVAQAILQPDPGSPVYICGEAYSLVDQGWVEGALETANSVMGMLGVQAVG
jgi:monoamine oxidase